MRSLTKKRYMLTLASLALLIAVLCTSTLPVYAWRSTSTRTINGYKLIAKADLPKLSDVKGGGAWKAQAQYAGPKNADRLTVSWSFYSIGGSVSYSGVGCSGSGSSPGGSYSAKNKIVNASGKVYGHGLWLYIGMYSAASFSYGNSYYSTTCKI